MNEILLQYISSGRMNRLKSLLAPALGYSRFALYSMESAPLVWTRRILGANRPPLHHPPKESEQTIQSIIEDLLRLDQENIRNDIYPIELLLPENPVEHLRRYWEILKDGVGVSLRARNQDHRNFSDVSSEQLATLPEYYQRNFHHQTDGYLSRKSAELYAHQTEILFKGSIDLMRRVLLAPLITSIRRQEHPVRILELGCGAGETTEILLRSCPSVQIHAIDLSQAYLDFTKERLSQFQNLRCERADASQYQPPEPVDFVVSSFLFHEIPLKVRKDIHHNISRHLQPGGTICHIDSLQLGDRPELDWALKQFPRDFHEPFYRNYIAHPLADLLAETSTVQDEQQAFLAKAVYAVQPMESSRT